MATRQTPIKVDDNTRARPLIEAAKDSSVIVEIDGQSYRVDVQSVSAHDDLEPTSDVELAQLYQSVPALKTALTDREMTDRAWDDHAHHVAIEGL